MKIEVQNPNIIRVAYHQEPGDHLYGSCLWAYYDFDLDKYMMNVQSDCGNAAYRWCATPKTESFLRLIRNRGRGRGLMPRRNHSPPHDRPTQRRPGRDQPPSK